MNQLSHPIKDFSVPVFWDANKSELEIEKSTVKIIYKVLEFGLLSDWDLIVTKKNLDATKTVS